MRKIAVCVDFMTEAYRRQIDAAAQQHGFAVHYYDSQAALTPYVADYEILYAHPAPALLKQAKNLKWLCSDYAGVDKYLDDAVWPNGDCLLSNSSGAYGPTISEHVIMVLLMLLRRMPEYERAMAKKQWAFLTPIRSIIGSHIMVWGTGDIGSNIARRLKAMGAEVTGVCRSGRSEEPAFDRVLTVEEMNAWLPKADALVMALPATPETEKILNGERIALLPERALVVNVGRGVTVDQQALTQALLDGKLAGAALDVMTPEPLTADDPLWSCENVILTPHVSGNVALGLTCDIDVNMFCEDLGRYAAGEKLHRLVDRRRGY